MAKVKILRVWIEHRVDEEPDTSCLGEYGKDWKEGCIDREECGDMERNEFRYFYPADNGEKVGTADYVKYADQDYKRMESLNRGDWCYVGVIAKAEVWNSDSHIVQVIHSGGLWGVESDAGEYFKEVEGDELNGLMDELCNLGLSERAVNRAFRDVEHKEA